MTEYERFGLVFTKTRVYKFGHRICIGTHSHKNKEQGPTVPKYIYVERNNFVN
jgi:hypothetical protein